MSESAMTPLLPVIVFTVLNITRIVCMPSFVETDSIVFPKDNATSQAELSDKLKQCIQDDFKIEYNGECHVLLTTVGVCPEGRWLVLDMNFASLPKPKIVGKCVEKRCKSVKEHYWVSLRRCVSGNETSELCPKGNELSTDMFGDGYCKCVEKPIHAKAIDGKCYPVYKRGPCSTGSVWVEENDRAECQADNCHSLRLQLPNKTIVPWRNNCYALDDRGPCEKGTVVIIHPWNKRPECGENFATLALSPPPPCQGTDHSSHCTGVVRTPSQQFLNNVAGQVHGKRHKKMVRSTTIRRV